MRRIKKFDAEQFGEFVRFFFWRAILKISTKVLGIGRPRASFTSQQLLCFCLFFYCCLQQHNDSRVTMTVVGGDRFVPVVVDIDCAQGAKSARNVFQSFSL